MMRFVLALVLAAACSGSRGTTAQSPGSGSGEPLPPKRVTLAWGTEPAGSTTTVFLQTTDETGKQVSHPVGAFAGTCATSQPAAEMKAVIAIACKDGATGYELHAVPGEGTVIILKMRIDEGVTPDPMAREEVTRVAVPIGAAISAG